jgi:hypothetical protein
MAQRQIINGAWQDCLGNPLALGYLTFRLNTDGQSGVQVSAGRLVTVPLDSSGNIAGTVLLWPNDQLAPAGSTYSVIAYTAKGQPAWRNPKFSLPSGVGSYDFSA